MSDSSDDLEGFDFDEVLDWIESYYHVVVVVGLAAFMFWNRIRTWGNFVNDGEVMFSGNDPWYHYRQTTYTVQNFPETMPYDVWTYFPYGNASGQFGTLLDQMMAAVALIVGLGNPDQQTIAMVVLVMPVVLATLTVIPAYLIGRRLGGRFGGVVAVLVLALATGRFLSLSRVGFADHHIAEALFQALAVLGIMVAVSVAARDKPIYEQLRERDIDALREPLGWAALAGVAVTAYLWVWPFGAMLLGILGVFFVLQLNAEFLRGESPEHTALVGAVAMGVTGITVLASINVTAFSPSNFSLLQPILAFAVAGGCVFMAWLAREWEARDIVRIGYPLAVGGVILASVLALLIVLPDVFDTLLDGLLRMVGFSVSPTAGTVGEAQPLPAASELYASFGFAILLATIGALWIVGRLALGRSVSASELLIVVWAVFITAATFTQSRFEYYLAVPVAGLTGYAIGNLFRWLNLDFDPSKVEVYQVLAVITVVMVVVVPMVLGSSSAIQVGGQNGPSPSSQGWNEALDWMEENTPEEGMYDSESTDLEYYGTYEAQEDFDYEEGAYGVMSWWDYGHWITVMGERIPHANPHQQGSTTAANFLLSPNESQANDVLEGIEEDDAQNRYVMVDWQMVEPTTYVYYQSQPQQTNGKFFAPPNFYDRGDVQIDDYTNTLYHARDSNQDGQPESLFSFNATNQRYYNTTVARLYHYHGSAMDAQPIVLDWNPQTFGEEPLPMTPPDDTDSGQALRVYNNMSEARQYVENDTTSQIGGVGPYPSQDVPALENYRLVGTSETSASEDPFGRYQVARASSSVSTGINSSFLERTSPQWTKVFERVPGATIAGSGPSDASVRATVEMYNSASDETFEYRQYAETDGEGDFELTVPYSTSGYDEWGLDEGRTNVSVRATGNYSIQAVASDGENVTLGQGSVDVPEGAVIGETEEPITVELSEIDTPGQQDAGEDNETGDGTNGDETAESGDESDDSGNETGSDGTGDGNVTDGALAEPSVTDATVTP